MICVCAIFVAWVHITFLLNGDTSIPDQLLSWKGRAVQVKEQKTSAMRCFPDAPD